eukprot:scaffold90712_cov20-Tisochrysis_lutea.AAC.2
MATKDGTGMSFNGGCLWHLCRALHVEGMNLACARRFNNSFEVELASRVDRVWDEDGNLDAAALDLGEAVLKVRSCMGTDRQLQPWTEEAVLKSTLCARDQNRALARDL